MRVLFYFVHPAKFHLFNYTIKKLQNEHKVDIVINSKDVLEDLMKNEGLNFTNIFPNGRNISKKPSLIKSGLKFFLTILRLEKYLKGKPRYDLFITDDSLVVNGWIRRIPSYIFNDNDIDTIKINKILFYFASKIISPSTTHLGKFEKKKISFNGNKALAHLHPKYFSVDTKVLKKYRLENTKFGIIRLSKINATHDFGVKGINDSELAKIVDYFSCFGTVIISAEREIRTEFHKYLFLGSPSDFTNLLYFSNFYLGDSLTIGTEASILGVPSIVINPIAKKCGVNRNLKEIQLQNYFDEFSESEELIFEIIKNCDKIKNENQSRISSFINQCDDLNDFLWNLFVQNNKIENQFNDENIS